MLNWTITRFDAAESLDPKSPPPYCVLATVTFASLAHAKEALMTASEETGKDIANYTNVVPAVWVARDVAAEADCQGKAA